MKWNEFVLVHTMVSVVVMYSREHKNMRLLHHSPFQNRLTTTCWSVDAAKHSRNKTQIRADLSRPLEHNKKEQEVKTFEPFHPPYARIGCSSRRLMYRSQLFTRRQGGWLCSAKTTTPEKTISNKKFLTHIHEQMQDVTKVCT